MKTYQVNYYVQPEGAARISKLGGSWGEKTELLVMNEIYNNSSQYFVSGGGHEEDIEVEYKGRGAPYLKTIPDGMKIDTLSYLPRHYA